MEQRAEGKSKPFKQQKIYLFCRNLIALAITLIALVPIVYLLGSDESLYPARPLFAAYAEDAYFQSKLADIQAALNSSFIVNLHAQGDRKEGSVREWQNLQQFVRFLGHFLNRQQLVTVNRFIFPPAVKPQKKGKNAPRAENQRLVEEAYAISNSGQMNAIRNKLNKVAVGTINRLKTKQRDPKNEDFGEVIRGRIIDEVLAPKIWIITIHPDNWQYHSHEELRKQLAALSKEGEKDRFVVVSISPADSDWKRMKPIPISINEGVFSSIKSRLRQVVKAYFPFEVNTSRIIESVLCHYESSLFQLNNFLQHCNGTFSCHNSIRLLSKRAKKGEDGQVMELLNELCSVGHIDEQNAQFKSVLDSLGFYGGHEGAEESIKLYFAVASGKKCKGTKQCSYQWLKNEAKTPANQTKKQQTDKPEPIKPEPIKPKPQVVNSSEKEMPSEILRKQKPLSQSKTKPKEKSKAKQSTKPKKVPKKQEQGKKLQQKQAVKQNKAKKVGKNEKVKSKPINLPKQIEVQVKQCQKIPCQQDLQTKSQISQMIGNAPVDIQQIKVDSQSNEIEVQFAKPAEETASPPESSELATPIEQNTTEPVDHQQLLEQIMVEADQNKQQSSDEPVKEETEEPISQLVQNSSDKIESDIQDHDPESQLVSSSVNEGDTRTSDVEDDSPSANQQPLSEAESQEAAAQTLKKIEEQVKAQLEQQQMPSLPEQQASGSPTPESIEPNPQSTSEA